MYMALCQALLCVVEIHEHSNLNRMDSSCSIPRTGTFACILEVIPWIEISTRCRTTFGIDLEHMETMLFFGFSTEIQNRPSWAPPSLYQSIFKAIITHPVEFLEVTVLLERSTSLTVCKFHRQAPLTNAAGPRPRSVTNPGTYHVHAETIPRSTNGRKGEH